MGHLAHIHQVGDVHYSDREPLHRVGGSSRTAEEGGGFPPPSGISASLDACRYAFYVAHARVARTRTVYFADLRQAFLTDAFESRDVSLDFKHFELSVCELFVELG